MISHHVPPCCRASGRLQCVTVDEQGCGVSPPALGSLGGRGVRASPVSPRVRSALAKPRSLHVPDQLPNQGSRSGISSDAF